MDVTIPFFQNDDDRHCLQAAYMMILKHFRPDYQIDWNNFSQVTGYEKGKGTWAMAGLLWFKDHGFEAKHITLFDYAQFAQTGADYLLKQFGKEAGQWAVNQTNLPVEEKRAIALIDSGICEHREPTLQDIKGHLRDGYLVRCMVNSRQLNGKTGYTGHAVVVKGYDSDGLIMNDPGLPPLENRHVTYDRFEAAWAYPNIEAKEMDAIRLAP